MLNLVFLASNDVADKPARSKLGLIIRALRARAMNASAQLVVF